MSMSQAGAAGWPVSCGGAGLYTDSIHNWLTRIELTGSGKWGSFDRLRGRAWLSTWVQVAK